MTFTLVDTHAHMDEIEDVSGTLDRAREAGLVAIIAVGSDYESNRKVLELARQYPGFVYPALGLHPMFLAEADLERDLFFIREHISEAVGLGEIGLDYHKRVRATADKQVQADALRKLLEIAAEYDKPALLHTRYAWRDAFDIVKESGIRKAVFHWYTGTSSVLRDIIESGYFISATPAVEYHEEHRRAVKAAPPERLLLETDAPVVYGRGSDTEFEARPADVLRSLTGAAGLTGLGEEELAGITTRNAQELFGIVPRS